MRLKNLFAKEPDRNDLPTDFFFPWLVQLRWGAVACQALVLAVTRLATDIPVPLAVVLTIIGFEFASNALFHYIKRRGMAVPEWLFHLVMFLDVILLTALLALTGGHMNPFTFLYLVHIVLGAILMRGKWAWALTAFTVLCYAAFFLPADSFLVRVLGAGIIGQIESLCHDPGLGASGFAALHFRGMWLAFAITSFFVVFFVARIQLALENHRQTLVTLRDEKLRSEKMAALATLAAGAAHEFSTPLSTIAVAAGEMHHYLKHHAPGSDLLHDTRLIRQQVERCKEILYQMSADAGEHLGEAVEEMSIRELADETVAQFQKETGKAVAFSADNGDLRVRLPPRTIRRCLKGLLKNGLDASGQDKPLGLRCSVDNDLVRFEITDQGTGMDEATLAKACEPFFTRKEPGKGLGLGLYLAQSVAKRFGGDVTLSSTPGQGTTAILTLSVETK